MSESRFPHPTGTNSPVPLQRLKQIANDACFAALEKVEAYDHSRTEAWNNTIINHILRALISESTPTGATHVTSPYKFSVNSTIIQHMSQRNSYLSAGTSTNSPSASSTQDPTSTVSPAAAASPGAASVGSELNSGRASNENSGVGRRGMHSACGAYWNNEKDGMWSYKYETRGIFPQDCPKAAGAVGASGIGTGAVGTASAVGTVGTIGAGAASGAGDSAAGAVGGTGDGAGGAMKKRCKGLTGCCGKGLDVVISVIWIAV